MQEQAVAPEIPAVASEASVRLNIGAGSTVIDGYIPVDIKTGTDARTLPYPDESVDEVYASHVLEHLPRDEAPKALAEWARVLKPGGIMRIGVPNVPVICKAWNELDEPHLMMVLYGSQDDQTNHHGWGYSSESLRHAMNNAGIVQVREFSPFASDCTRHPCSLNLEGVKRAWKKRENPKVCWVITQGRFALTEHTRCMVNLAHRLQFGQIPCSGVFWERDMQQSIRLALQTDADYLMFTDFDSVFSADDAEYMLKTINNDPTIGVVTAPQMSRHDDKPLVFEEKLDYSGEFTRVKFSHFGLTFMRREVFDDLPEPWFWTIPGVNQSRELGYDFWNRSDADITFWRNLHEAGIPVVQCNKCVIGHLIEAVKWPCNKGFGVQLQPIPLYHRDGRPATATINQDIYRKKLEDAREKAARSNVEPSDNAIPKESGGTLAHQHDQG